MGDLTLIKTEKFGMVKCDFYKNDANEILMTREQIGTALEYSDPSDAIRKIHERHKNRLDKFSVQDKLTGTDGKQYLTYLYTAKGVMEICRWSQQPKADIFMDWVWDIIDGLRKGELKLLQIPKTLPEALRAYADEVEKNMRLEEEKKKLLPKAEFFDAVAGSKDAIAIGDAAKVLNAGIGQNKLFKFLRDKKILKSDNIPYQEFIDRGYFRTIEQKWTTPNGETRIYIKTLIYQKGLDYIRKLLNKKLEDKELA